MATPSEVLSRWIAAHGPAPLITSYDGPARVELSGTSAMNAVNKAVNLFADELLLDPGDVVWLDLPCHWQAPVLAIAAWAAGLAVAVGPQPPPGTAATLGTGAGPSAGTPLAVSLHPWGMPLGPATPPGWEDCAALTRIQPDSAALRWTAAGDTWLIDEAGRPHTGDALLRRAGPTGAQPPSPHRLLTRRRPDTAAGLLACTLLPAAAGASVILATSGDIAGILRQEGNAVETSGV